MSDDLIGAEIDHWKITRKLGEGAMGAVYEAHGNGEHVAIKVALPNTLSPSSLERFRREAHILMDLDDPHVVRCMAAGESDDFVYLALEFMEGGTLQALLEERGKIPVPQAVGVVRRVLQGLQAVHGKGIVHRDLKPDNVLLDDRGRPKLADFSLARAEAHAGITTAGTIVGTMDYMSPEQCKAEDLDGRADLYAVGAMLYHLVAGNPPYEGRSGLAVLQKHLNDPIPDISRDVPKAKALRLPIQRLMAKDPDDRPKDAEKALALLKGFDEEPLFEGKVFTPAHGMAALGAPRTGSPSKLLDLLALLAVVAAGAAAALHFRPDLLAQVPAQVGEAHAALGPGVFAVMGAGGFLLLDRIVARISRTGLLGRLVGR